MTDLYAKYQRRAAAAFANRAILAATNTALNAMSDDELFAFGATLRQRIAAQEAYVATLTEEARVRIWDGVVAKLEAERE